MPQQVFRHLATSANQSRARRQLMNRDEQASVHADELLMTPPKAVIVGRFKEPSKAVLAGLART
jgi:hypothetical protein